MLDFGFYNMDCMDGMREFPDKYFDLAIVDPPYGIHITERHVWPGKGSKTVRKVAVIGKNERKPRPTDKASWNFYKNPADRRFYHPFDDSSPPDETYFRELIRVSKNQIIWGGNFFLDYLGAATCFVVWDKGRRNMDQADCELAWTSLPGQSRIFNFKWNGMLQEDMKEKEYRIHPTQKPMRLYEWLLQKFAKQGDVILDTHVGSASSLVACQRLGFKYVGFEIDEDYYNLAKHRLETEGAQMTIFNFIQEESDNEIVHDRHP